MKFEFPLRDVKGEIVRYREKELTGQQETLALEQINLHATNSKKKNATWKGVRISQNDPSFVKAQADIAQKQFEAEEARIEAEVQKRLAEALASKAPASDAGDKTKSKPGPKPKATEAIEEATTTEAPASDAGEPAQTEPTA